MRRRRTAGGRGRPRVRHDPRPRPRGRRAPRRGRGPHRRRRPPHLRWPGCGGRPGRSGVHRRRDRARGPGRDLGAQHRRVGRRPARPAVRRRRAGADEQPLQGHRGRLPAAHEPGPGAAHRPGVPRQRLRRHARGPRPARTSSAPSILRGDVPGRHGVVGRLPGRAARPSTRPRLEERVAALDPDDVVRHPLHLGHDREPQGACSAPTARPCAATRTGATMVGPAGGRPLPRS